MSAWLVSIVAGGIAHAGTAQVSERPEPPSSAPPADIDEVLPVRDPRERAARDALVPALRAVRLDFRADGWSVAELARFLTAASDEAVNFAFLSRGDAAVAADAIGELDLELPATSLWRLIAIVQRVLDVRFVYEHGLVALRPKEEVRIATELHVYDLGAALAPLRDRPGPELGLGRETDAFRFADDVDDGKTISGLTADRIEELVRGFVAPDTWDRDGVSLAFVQGRQLWVRQTAAVHRELRRFLAKLGVLPAAPARSLPRSPARRRTAVVRGR